MVRLKRFFTYIFLCFLVMACASCGNGSSDSNSLPFSQPQPQVSQPRFYPPPPTDCSTMSQNRYVNTIMNDAYLWSEEVPDKNIQGYGSPEALLKDLQYQKFDKWSYIAPAEEFNNLFSEGTYIGLGFGNKFGRNNEFYMSFVYKNSPADLAGIQRGDKLLEINETTIQDIIVNGLWDSISGPDEAGVEVNLKLENQEGVVSEVTLEKNQIRINTVLDSRVINVDATRIGYLAFMSFLSTSKDELDAAFTDFARTGIDELIVDVRYNTGGLIDVAEHLASLIAGDHVAGKIFSKFLHNETHTFFDFQSVFTPPQNTAHLDTVHIITSKTSCSASETLINSLTPFIDVVLVGEDSTCGKPVGMYACEFCDKIFQPVTVKVANANNETDYFDGFAPDCYSNDDLTMELGNIEEDSLKKTLYYIANGSCAEAAKSGDYKKPSKTLELNGFRREIGAF